MFSQEMIKSSLEPPKKSPRSVNNNKVAPSKEIKVFNVNYENFGIFSKKIVEPSSALIPPWIKNSLKLSEKSGSFGSQTESNSTKFLFKCDETKSYDFASNSILEKDVTSVNTEQGLPFVEVNIRQVTGFTESLTDHALKETSGMVLNKRNMKESENQNPPSRDKKSKNLKSEVTSIDVVMALDGNMLQQKSTDDEKRKSKNHRQKVKTKKRTYDEHKSDDIIRSELDVMLEKKAREMLEKYLKKDIHNAVENESEGKFAVLNGKVKPESVKLAEEDLLLLQEIKEQIGSKENIEKILENIKANEVKTKKKEEVKHICEKHRNRLKDNLEKNKSCQNQAIKNEEVIKETFLSTDDENEIKKFSEFLSKNKNAEEKRRCLEEVRNYFDKKRCSRIERQVKKSDEAHQTIPSTPVKKEKDSTVNDAEKKTSGEQSDEVVEKAVSETLQKFTELYRFEIPQNVIQDMKKSIIKTIKSENLGQSQNKKNLDGISLIFELKDGVDNIKSSSLSVIDNQNHKICVVPDENNAAKELKCSKKNPFKTVIDTKIEKDKKVEDNESRNLKELMKDFEQCLDSIKAQVDITGTKLCSVVFEKTDGDNATKKAKLVYNFKKADSLRISYEKNPDGDGKSNKNNENSKKSTKTQTIEDFLNVKKESMDKTVQTKEKKTMKMSTQTEWKPDKINETGPIKIVRTPEGDHANGKCLNKQNESELLANILDSKNQPVSKEFSQSDKGILTKDKKSKKLERSIKSDCLGVNKQPQRQSEQKKKVNVTAVNYLFLKQDQPNTEPNLRCEMDGDAIIMNKDEVKASKNHTDCVWLWNGKKIDPGCDLKIQVEELMKEKIKELMDCNKVARTVEGGYRNDYDCKTGVEMTSTESFTTSAESSERNLEIRKVDGKFCFSKSSNASMNEVPFVFTAESRDLAEEKQEKQPPDKIWDKTEESTAKITDEKQFREVGTQNSQQNFHSKLNLSKSTTRSKGKISRHKFKNTTSSNSLTTEPKPKAVAVAKKVSETKKVKLEVEKENTFIVDEDSNQSLNSNSNPGFDSLLSNSTYSAESEELTPVRSLQNEDKKPCSKNNVKEEEVNESQEDAEAEKKNLKQWEFIESVLNRVNQKEKENLWDDIRDFVKTKIGRDINDEGAREVCIEIEQDLPKQRKGKTNQTTIVAKGNYTRNEGDIEVEVDLTLDDLERILKHRQKKLRRRQTYTKGFESKPSTTSAAIASMEEIQKYQTFLNSCKALGGDYITESELKIIKDNEN